MQALLTVVVFGAVLAANLAPAFLAGRRYRRILALMREFARRTCLPMEEKPTGVTVEGIYRRHSLTLRLTGAVLGGYQLATSVWVWFGVTIVLPNPDRRDFVLNRRRLFNFLSEHRGLPLSNTGLGRIDEIFEFRSPSPSLVQSVFGQDPLLANDLIEARPDRLELTHDELVFACTDLEGRSDSLDVTINLMVRLAEAIAAESRGLS